VKEETTTWPSRPLGELLSIQSGFAFKSTQFSTTKGVPLIRIRDLKNGTSTEVNFDGDFDSQYQVGRGDFLIGMDGEFRCHQWQGETALLNQRVCRLKDFSPDLHPRFLFHGINKYLAEIENRTAYTTVKHLSAKTIKAINFPLPPLEEQRRIVAILDEAFEGLARARAHAEANLRDAKELFNNSLLALYSEIDAVAPRKTLSEAATGFGRGRSRHRPRNAPFLYGGPYPFIQTGDVRQADGVLLDYTQTYSEQGLAQSKLWPEGTVCITIAANIAETAVLGFDACFPDSVIGMVPDPTVTSSSYVEYMLRYFAAELKAQGKGSAQDNINLGTFEQASFPFPEMEVQSRVVERLDEIGRQTALLTANYVKTLADFDQLRQSILKKAFSGGLS